MVFQIAYAVWGMDWVQHILDRVQLQVMTFQVSPEWSISKETYLYAGRKNFKETVF
jgi:hypothetical protein